MHPVIEHLKSTGKWYIVPDGQWADSLTECAQNRCVCGHSIEHVYFACRSIDGEVVETVEVGCQCVMDLTNGHFYRTPYAGNWHIVSDDDMLALFYRAHSLKSYNGKSYYSLKGEGGRFPAYFAESLYDFAMRQVGTTGLARLTDKQYDALQNLLSKKG